MRRTTGSGAALCFLLLLLHGESAPLPVSPGAGENVGVAYLSGSLAMSLFLLLGLVLLLLNCTTCCKEQDINFKEFEDNFDDEIDFTPPAEDTPSAHSPAEVYTLTVPTVALPGPPHLEPHGDLNVSDVSRHNLSYVQEMASGWFGKVLLSELFSDLGASRVVVQELKPNAGIREQNLFVQHAEPYRVLQHPNILQCVGQCVEALPFLQLFEFCELGDLKNYLSHQDWMQRGTEEVEVQRMACEIAAAVSHLHKHNFLHRDLSLRNCFLTKDLNVKVGDYGIGPWMYRDDYIITDAEIEVPLRWMAPELISELHGVVVSAEQTKPGNIWALGVTLWELFESGSRPYRHLSDREVLIHVIREKQVKLFRPQLELPHADRWYEVLQFCWLLPDKRATAEEVHRLLTYLRMQAQQQSEDDFEQRWKALRPHCTTPHVSAGYSSFPILENFGNEQIGSEPDEMLTVMETSRGLSFKYVWEPGENDCCQADAVLNYSNVFFPTSGISPSVTDTHKPTVGDDCPFQVEGVESHVCAQNKTAMSQHQHSLVLQDVPLEESGTDMDFFHHSIDSKDSYIQEGHAWSSNEAESPSHSNIFRESSCQGDVSSSWTNGFLELSELNGSSLQSDTSMGKSNSHTVFPEAPNSENLDMMQLLNAEILKENFLFLKKNSLMKESYSQSLSEDGTEVNTCEGTENELPSQGPQEKGRALCSSINPGTGNAFVPRKCVDSGAYSLRVCLSSGGSDSSSPISHQISLPLSHDRDIASVGACTFEDSRTSTLSLSVTQNDSSVLRPGLVVQAMRNVLDLPMSNLCLWASKTPLLLSDQSVDKLSPDSLQDSGVSISANTPDSVDSEDIQRLVGTSASEKLGLQHRTADSGYDTENLESPELNLQPGSTLSTLPEIIISEIDCEHEQKSSEVTPDGEVLRSSQNQRDSAYFSDNESENECPRSTMNRDSYEFCPEGGKTVCEVRDAQSCPQGMWTKEKKPEVGGRFLGKLDRMEEGKVADEDSENEDSDEELQVYRLQSSGSDSGDDEPHPVPIIISNGEETPSLRSLLKSPTSCRGLQGWPKGGGCPKPRKAISFFDDVTVYLFDQDRPTQELMSSVMLGRSTPPEGSTDEEGGGFEWDDDFSSPETSFISSGLIVPKTSSCTRLFSPPPPSHAGDSNWSQSSPSNSHTSGQAQQSYWSSYLSASSASMASFSLTHITDSDTEQAGSGEDGERD